MALTWPASLARLSRALAGRGAPLPGGVREGGPGAVAPGVGDRRARDAPPPRPPQPMAVTAAAGATRPPLRFAWVASSRRQETRAPGSPRESSSPTSAPGPLAIAPARPFDSPSMPIFRAAPWAMRVPVPVAHASATAAASAPSTPWWRVRTSSGRKPPRPGSGTPGASVPTQVGGLRSLQPFLPLPPPRIRSAPASVVSLATPSASRRSSPRMSIVPSWNLGMVAPPRVAVGGAPDRLCVAAIVPFPRIRPVAISDSGTMAASARPTVKPDGPFAYTNVYDVILPIWK